MKHPIGTLLVILCLFGASTSLTAQVEFTTADFDFFDQKKEAINDWLEYEGLAKYLVLDLLAYDSESLEVTLAPANLRDNCHYVKHLWDGLLEKYQKERDEALHVDIMSGIAFVMEVPKEQLTVKFTCGDPAGYHIIISADRSPDDELIIEYREMGDVETMSTDGDPVIVNIESLKPEYLVQFDDIDLEFTEEEGNKLTVSKVSQEIERFLKTYYASKGTPVIYKAKSDVVRSYYNEFDISVKHLSHTVLEEGYFEYHEFHVTVIQQGEKIIVNWDFKGKYGSGILFAPRRSDYKEMKKNYPEDVMRFEKIIYAALNQFLSKQP